MNKINVRTVGTRKQYLKWSFRLTFKRIKQFRDGPVTIEESVKYTLMNQVISEQAF